MLKSREALALAEHEEQDRAQIFLHKLQAQRQEETAKAWPRYQQAVTILHQQEADRKSYLKRFPATADDTLARKKAGVALDDLDLILLQRAERDYGGALEREYGVKRRPSYLARPAMLNGPSARVRQVMVEKAEEIIREHGRGKAGKLTRLWRLYVPPEPKLLPIEVEEQQYREKLAREEEEGASLGTSQARRQEASELMQQALADKDLQRGGRRYVGPGQKAARGFHHTPRSLWGDERFADDATAMVSFTTTTSGGGRNLRPKDTLADTHRLNMSLAMTTTNTTGQLAGTTAMRTAGRKRPLLPSVVAATGKGLKTLRKAEAMAMLNTTAGIQQAGAGRLQLSLPDSRYQALRTVQASPRGRHVKARVNAANLFHEDPALDLPLGLDEPVLRLLRCAVLRAFVPTNAPPGSSPSDAFARYVSMPPCLAKVEHERQAFAHADHIAVGLRQWGIKFCRDLLPWEEKAELMEQAGMGAELRRVCEEVLSGLERVSLLGKYGTLQTLAGYRALEEQDGGREQGEQAPTSPMAVEAGTESVCEQEDEGPEEGDAGTVVAAVAQPQARPLGSQALSLHDPASRLLALAMFNVQSRGQGGLALQEELAEHPDQQARRELVRQRCVRQAGSQATTA